MFLKWKGTETTPDGDLYVRSGPGTVKLAVEDVAPYIRTWFPATAGAAGGSTGDQGSPS